MTFDQENPTPQDVPPQPAPHPQHEEPLRIVHPIPVHPPRPPKQPVSIWRIISGVFFGMSILANIFLFLALIGVAVFFVGGYEDTYREEVLQAGPRDCKIVVVNLKGVIDDKLSEAVIKQLQRVKDDGTARAMILQINSPGGGVAASDRIYKEVASLSKDSGIPTVACMQDLAASGGYYSAVGCDTIVAEPTTITGSIGVIMSSFVVQELLENKLGIQPVVIKAGAKKDWPSPFKAVTDEQREYLTKRLIQPAYERFVSVVKDGRPDLTSEQVDELADGSIYTGEMAMKVGLVDKVGYMKDAIDEAKRLAKVKDAMVVRYKEPVTLSELLTGAESRTSILNIDSKSLHEMSTPQLMYLWSY
jgi:protease IV